MRFAVGDHFVTRLGPCRVLYDGDKSYFQKHQRRYLCRVVSWRDEFYRSYWDDLCETADERSRCRRVLTVEVIAT
ncbi:hypothetical protein LCGC14_2623510 [marine sediment metagenome]|uniref:Uncharacterized protein n=1 Tax=marine sediment metagenome TaxID=412755 RepID=A0A0F9CDH5_9ZZZZ